MNKYIKIRFKSLYKRWHEFDENDGTNSIIAYGCRTDGRCYFGDDLDTFGKIHNVEIDMWFFTIFIAWKTKPKK